MKEIIELNASDVDPTRIPSLIEEVLEHVYMVSPMHVDYGSMDGKEFVRHVSLEYCMLELIAGNDEQERTSVLKEWRDMGVTKTMKSIRVPVHFYPMSTLMNGHIQYQSMKAAKFTIIDPTEVIRPTPQNLKKVYRMNETARALMPDMFLECGYLLKNPTAKIEPFNLLFNNSKAYPYPNNTPFILISRNLAFWKLVTRKWYERTHQGLLWQDLSTAAQYRHLVNCIRHNSCYDFLRNVGDSRLDYIKVYEAVNVEIGKTFPCLRTEALRQIENKELAAM